MNRWKLRVALLAVLVGLGALSLPALPTPTVSASNVCYGRSGVYHDGPFGSVWTRDQVCPNAYGAPVYGFPTKDPTYRTGTMLTTNSWFVCYEIGPKHKGGNHIWYLTQADVGDPDWTSAHGWGYMPAWYVYTNDDPDPGMPRCPKWS